MKWRECESGENAPEDNAAKSLFRLACCLLCAENGDVVRKAVAKGRLESATRPWSSVQQMNRVD